MGALDGRVAIITGAGNGLGREHTLPFAREGAKVVVNGFGGDPHGEGAGNALVQRVVDEITAARGEAAAVTDNVTERPASCSTSAQATMSQPRPGWRRSRRSARWNPAVTGCGRTPSRPMSAPLPPTARLRVKCDEPEGDSQAWDPQQPGNVRPTAAGLSTADRTITGECFHVSDELLPRYRPRAVTGDVGAGGKRRTAGEPRAAMPKPMNSERRGDGLDELRAFHQVTRRGLSPVGGTDRAADASVDSGNRPSSPFAALVPSERIPDVSGE